MFAKLFSRITESSLMEEDIPVRYTFVMMLAIADAEGDVIGTDIAIARRLNMPVGEFQRCVGVLSTPDASSNSKDMEGRRIIPGDSERGYKVVNYIKYRELTTEFQKKAYMRRYMREYREKGKVNNDDVKLTKSYRKTALNTLDTPSLTSASVSVSSSQGKESEERKGNVTQAVVTQTLPKESAEGKGAALAEMELFQAKLCKLYSQSLKRRWSHAEQSTLFDLTRSAEFAEELEEIVQYRGKLKAEEIRFFPQSLERLLSQWTPTLDKARTYSARNTKEKSLPDKELDRLCSRQ